MDEMMIPSSEVELDQPARRPIDDLVDQFLAGRSPETLRAYRADLADFAAFAGQATVGEAVEQLLGHGPGEANHLALAYKNHLLEAELAPATINRRLAALRSMSKLARTVGMITFSLEVENVRHASYRDTRGPGVRGFRRMLGELDDRDDAKGARDRAILRLLFDLALRRGEVVGLDLEHLDLEAGTVAVMGKGHRERTRMTLPGPTQRALGEWVEHRGREAGPLFTSLSRRSDQRGGRLSGTSVYRLVRRLGEEADVGQVRPHGLRHAAITTALDATNGDVRGVQKFSRHASLQTVVLYDDVRRDVAGEIAAKVAAEGGES